MKFVLASASPRRRELLNRIGICEFDIRPVAGEPEPQPDLTPEETVMMIAADKASRAEAAADELVLAADTLVFMDGVPLGKPTDEADARRMLRMLSGKTHQVVTGLALRLGDRLETAFEKTDVHFAELTEAEIDAYIATGEPMDKAGAYGIQSRGALLVTGISGDYSNVVGLPLYRLGQMLKRFDYCN